MMDGDWLKRAIELAKQGKKQEARLILNDLVKQDPRNVQAWLWLVDTMPTLAERKEIIQEALGYNPGNPVLQRAGASIKAQEPPPPEEPRQTGLTFSTSELKALDTKVEKEPAQADWLSSLRTDSEGPTPTPTSSPLQSEKSFETRSEPPVTPARVPPTPMSDSESRAVADWLASFEKKSEPATPSQPPPVKASPLPSTYSPPPTPLGDAPLTSEKQTSSAKKKAEDASRVVDFLSADELEGPPPRRRWLGIVLAILFIGILAAAAVVGWPMIQPTIQNLISPPASTVSTEPAGEVVLPTAAETFTPSPTLTKTPTRTFTPTITRSPTPRPTATEIPLLVKAVPLEPENIQQFKPLGSVRARGSLSFDAQLLAGLADPQTVKIWDLLSGQPKQELKGPTTPIQQAAISPDGKYAAAVDEQPAVWVWNTEDGSVVATFEFSQDFTFYYAQPDFPKGLQIQFSPDSKAVIASSLLGMTWWDIETQQEHHLFPLLPTELKNFREAALHPTGKSAATFLVSFTPDGKALALGSPYKVYVLSWPGAGGRATLTTKLPLVSMKWMGNGLLGLAHPGSVSVWNTILNKQVISVPALKSQPTDVPPAAGFRQDGKWMAVAVENSRGVPGGLSLIDLATGNTLTNFDPHTDSQVDAVDFSLDGKLLFARSGGDLFVWDTTSGKELRRIANRKGFSAISPDGKYYVEVSAVDTSLWGAVP